MPDVTPEPPGIHRGLVRNTGFLLSRAGMLAQKDFSARIGQLELTTRQWGMLNVLDAEQGISQNKLGACVGMDPSSSVAAIDELERQGRVERRRDPNDRRAYALYLTNEGQATLAAGREIARKAQEQLFGALTSQERAQLHELLLKLM
jgi:DNA-binding MarR family transcriptional regulator